MVNLALQTTITKFYLGNFLKGSDHSRSANKYICCKFFCSIANYLLNPNLGINPIKNFSA